MEINLFLLATVIGCAIYIAVQEHEAKKLKAKINEQRTELSELNRSKRTVVQQDRIIKFFYRQVDKVPEINQAYNDLIGGQE